MTGSASDAATDPPPREPAHGLAGARVETRAALLMVTLCALWGLGQVSVKIGATGISPIWQAGLRSIGAALVLCLWMRHRRIALRPAPGMVRWGLLIGLAFALEFVCFYPGMALTTAARGTVLIYSAPFFVAIGGHLLLGDRLNRYRIGGLLLALAGVALALSARGGPGQGDWRGDLLCLAAGFMWAMTTLIVKATPLRSEQPERTLLYQLVVSAAVLPAWSLAVGEPGVFALTPVVVAALAYQVLVIASFSYLGWFLLIQRYSAASLSAFTFLTPLFGVAFAAVLLGETLTPSLIAAATLIAAGIYLVNRR